MSTSTAIRTGTTEAFNHQRLGSVVMTDQILWTEDIGTTQQPLAVPVPGPPPEPPKDAEFHREYQRVARKIGYECPASDEALGSIELLEFLKAEGMRVYGLDRVEAYMHSVAHEANVKRFGTSDFETAALMGGQAIIAWGWVGLRKCDILPARLASSGLSATDPRMSNYGKPIPFPVLLTIEKLVDRFGEKINLFISDIFYQKLDPFLAVSAAAAGAAKYVIERWGEPKFRDA